jgi:flagellar biosynthesis/type III secretory pathway protein FliH
MSQYRFQQQYLERERQQQITFRAERDHDYDRDPYYYTAPIYRYSRGGNFYETNEYGAGYLRQAINTGYQEGFRTGEADRQDRWHSDFRDSFAYRDANFGYNSYYLDQDDYNYYFREGFQRGYEDGFTSRYQYGRFAEGRYSILDSFSIQILGFQSLR